MTSPRQPSRRIVLFVEGDTERGDARRKTLPSFLHRWLDPQLPKGSRVGITAVKFQGVSNYLDDLAQKLALYLDEGRSNSVFGLVDLYGLPTNRIDLSSHAAVRDEVQAARKFIRSLVPQFYQNRFRQHFAVHEVEAWLLAYPEHWPPKVRAQISKRLPEQVNFDEPPARFLKRLVGGRYKKKTHAMNLFPKIDPQIAIDKCPFLQLFAQDLLQVARRLV
jgi:hypothetical protein